MTKTHTGLSHIINEGFFNLLSPGKRKKKKKEKEARILPALGQVALIMRYNTCQGEVSSSQRQSTSDKLQNQNKCRTSTKLPVNRTKPGHKSTFIQQLAVLLSI